MIFIVFLFILLSFTSFLIKTSVREWQRNLQRDDNLVLTPDRRHVVYVYHVPHTKEQIIEILSHKNAGDRLWYVFDKDTLTIEFANQATEFYDKEVSGDDYQLSFEEQGSSCILYVEKMTIFTRDSAGGVYLRMNEFWGAKVNASIYRK